MKDDRRTSTQTLSTKLGSINNIKQAHKGTLDTETKVGSVVFIFKRRWKFHGLSGREVKAQESCFRRWNILLCITLICTMLTVEGSQRTVRMNIFSPV